MEILSRNIRKQIEKSFFYRDKILKAVELEKQRLIKGNGGIFENIGASPTNKTSDSVGWRGAMLADIPRVIIEVETAPGKKTAVLVEWPERWLKVIERTKKKLSEGDCPLAADLIERRYAKKQKPEATFAELRIDKATYYNWLEGIINFAGMIAAELHIIKII